MLMGSNFEFTDLIAIISELLGVSAIQMNAESTPAEFEQWDSVMQLEILAQVESKLPGLLSFSPELPSKASVSAIWNEIELFKKS